MDVFQLRKGMLEGEFTSLDLVNVFSDRCYIIGRGLNLSTQENFRTAQQMAKEKDLEREMAMKIGDDEVKKLGLMHGIPISVKDSIYQKGKLSTFGLAYLCEELSL